MLSSFFDIFLRVGGVILRTRTSTTDLRNTVNYFKLTKAVHLAVWTYFPKVESNLQNIDRYTYVFTLLMPSQSARCFKTHPKRPEDGEGVDEEDERLCSHKRLSAHFVDHGEGLKEAHLARDCLLERAGHHLHDGEVQDVD